jgi:hypothetical protein
MLGSNLKSDIQINILIKRSKTKTVRPSFDRVPTLIFKILGRQYFRDLVWISKLALLIINVVMRSVVLEFRIFQ